MYDADSPDLDMVGELRSFAHDQGWTALDTMLVCLCLASEIAAGLAEPDRELMEAVH